MEIYEGKPIFKGIAIGKIFYYQKGKQQVKREKIQDVAAEIARYEAANEKVAFLKLGNLVIETYENKAAKMESGAIDHVAIDVKDVEKVHELVTAAGLNTTNDEVHFLPFWENGVKFFTIEGPNKEKVEFSQYL